MKDVKSEKKIPPIDLSSRLLQFKNKLPADFRKEEPSSQRSTPRIRQTVVYKPVDSQYNEQETFQQEKQLLLREINVLKSEVGELQQQMKDAFNSYKFNNSSSPNSESSSSSSGSLSLLSSHINQLQEELVKATKERRIYMNEFSPENLKRLETEMYYLNKEVKEMLIQYNSSLKRYMDIQSEINSDTVKESISTIQERKKTVIALTKELERLDAIEEQSREELLILLDQSDQSVEAALYLSTLKKKLKQLKSTRLNRIKDQENLVKYYQKEVEKYEKTIQMNKEEKYLKEEKRKQNAMILQKIENYMNIQNLPKYARELAIEEQRIQNESKKMEEEEAKNQENKETNDEIHTNDEIYCVEDVSKQCQGDVDKNEYYEYYENSYNEDDKLDEDMYSNEANIHIVLI